MHAFTRAVQKRICDSGNQARDVRLLLKSQAGTPSGFLSWRGDACKIRPQGRDVSWRALGTLDTFAISWFMTDAQKLQAPSPQWRSSPTSPGIISTSESCRSCHWAGVWPDDIVMRAPQCERGRSITSRRRCRAVWPWLSPPWSVQASVSRSSAPPPTDR